MRDAQGGVIEVGDSPWRRLTKKARYIILKPLRCLSYCAFWRYSLSVMPLRCTVKEKHAHQGCRQLH